MKISKTILLLYFFSFQLTFFGAINNTKDSAVKFFSEKILVEADDESEMNTFYTKDSFSKEKTVQEFENYKNNLTGLYKNYENDQSIVFKDNCYNPLTISFLLLAANAISDESPHESPRIFSFLERTNLVSNKVSLDQVKLKGKDKYNKADLFINLAVLDKRISRVPYLIFNGLRGSLTCGQVITCSINSKIVKKSDLIEVLAKNYTTQDDIEYFHDNFYYEKEFSAAYNITSQIGSQDFFNNVKSLIERAKEYGIPQKIVTIIKEEEANRQKVLINNDQGNEKTNMNGKNLLPKEEVIINYDSSLGEQSNEQNNKGKGSNSNKQTFFSKYKYHMGVGALFIGLCFYVFWQKQQRNNQI